jgi:hypothetical protein
MDVTKQAKPETKIDWKSIDMAVERMGEKIILPSIPGPMSYKDAREALQRIEEAENTVYAVSEVVPVHFYDGCVAFAKALKEKYGYSMSVPTPGFFGPKPPQMIHVKTGPRIDDFVQVPFGAFKIPNIDGTLQTGYAVQRGIPCFQINGSVKAKEKHIVMELVALTAHFVKEESIYKGKAVILERDESGGVDFSEPLGFFDAKIGEEVPIFNRETELLIATTLMAPIRNAKVCRDKKIPLKRGVLLEGPYGCGKTLTAKEVAKAAQENGWTFILVTASSALKYALNFAKMYQPAVVFAEDIDRIADNRNEGANDLLNQIDGVVGKKDEIITVLTTNFAHKIDKGFLRPGRLDTVISIRPPEAEAVERLIRFYAGKELAPGANLKSVTTKLAGQIPATIREVVERSKLSAIVNGNDHITTDDMMVGATSMENHWKLIEEAAEGVRTPDPLATAVGLVVNDNVRKALDAKFGK